MKKVSLVITKGNWGGAQRYVYDLARALPRDKYEVEVASGEPGELHQKLKDAGVPTHTIPSLQRAIWQLYRYFQTHDPDIIHLNSSKAGVVGSVAARIFRLTSKSKPRVIFTVHGWAFVPEQSSVFTYLYTFLQWLTVTLSDTVICVSQATADEGKSLWWAKEKFFLIYNGIQNPDLLTQEEARKALSAPKNKQIVGTVTELHPRKNLPLLINGFYLFHKEFPQSHLVIIGDGEERKKLEKKVGQLNLEHHVTFTGFIPAAELYLPAFDIFVLTSKREGLPYTLIETARASVPVVAVTTDGIGDIINEKTGFVVTEPTPKHLATQLRLAASRKADRRHITATLHTEAAEKFDFSRMVARTMMLYDKEK